MSRRRALIAATATIALVAAGIGIAGAAYAATTVSDYTELDAAFAAGTPDSSTVTLGADISDVTQELQVPDAAVLVLDLAGHDLDLRQLTLGAGSDLTITDASDTDPGVLTVGSSNYGEGGIRTTEAALTVGGYAVVDSTGGASVAGIGGGVSAGGGSLTVTDSASVTAQGGTDAAGIGGGYHGAPVEVVIDGDAQVDATGGSNAAGIGGGVSMGGGSTTIRGNASVTAQGGIGASGIGGGSSQGGGTTLIEGAATVHATGGSGGAGIGAVFTAGVQSVTIQGDAEVTATGGHGQTVGIGAGFGPGGQVTVADDAVVTAVGGSAGFGIGMGVAAHPADVSIADDAKVTASGGIGAVGGDADWFGDLTVDGELVIPAANTLALPSASDTVTGTGTLSGAGTVVNNGAIALPDAHVTVATINGNNFDVTLAANGGTLTPSTPIRVLATTMTAGDRSFPVAKRIGYLLSSWKNGTAAFTTSSALTGDVTVTAQWTSYAATLPTPTISGTLKVGSTLTADAHDSGWADGSVLSYTWLRNGVAIAGAPHLAAYDLTGADAGKQLSVTVTGTNTGQPTLSKTSAKTALISSGAITGLAAMISGPHQVGAAYTVSPTSSLPTAKYAYQWYLNGTAISQATAASWIATAGAQNGNVSVRITAAATGYTSASIVVTDDSIASAGHFVSTATPTIAGTVQAGQKLTAVPGAWSPAATFSYQWSRDGVAVPGATASTMVIPTNAMGSTWSLRVVGARAGYISVIEYSAPTGAALGLLTGATPKIAGTAKVGSTLTAGAGAWTPGTTLAYQWFRISGTTTTAITGATNATYTVAAADRGRTLKVRVVGTQAGYGALAKLSVPTVKVP